MRRLFLAAWVVFCGAGVSACSTMASAPMAIEAAPLPEAETLNAAADALQALFAERGWTVAVADGGGLLGILMRGRKDDEGEAPPPPIAENIAGFMAVLAEADRHVNAVNTAAEAALAASRAQARVAPFAELENALVASKAAYRNFNNARRRLDAEWNEATENQAARGLKALDDDLEVMSELADDFADLRRDLARPEAA